MDNINIEIESSSEKASQGVSTLIESLTNLNSKLSNAQNSAMKYTKNIQNIGNVLKSIKLPKLPKISDMFKRDKSLQENPLKNIEVNNRNNNTGKNSGNNNQGKKTKKDLSESTKTIEELKQTLGEATARIKDMLKYLGKIVVMKAGLKGLNAIFGGIGSKVSGLVGGFRTLAKNLSKYSLALFGIRSAFYAVRNTSNEFLSSQDAVAKQLSTNIAYLKFAIGSMFAPVIEYITNLIYKLLQAIQALVYYFTKINIFAGKTAKSYAGMGASAAKATKETQKQLQAFDELNNINFDKDNGNTGEGVVTPSFDLSGIREDLLPKFDDIENLFKSLADKINAILGGIKWDSIIEKTTKFTKKMAEALNSFTSELDFGLIGYTIAQGFNTVFANLNTFFSTYNFSQLGSKLGQGINSIIYTLNWEEMGKSMTNGFKAAIDTLFSMVTTIQWKDLGNRVGIAIKSAFANIDWKKTGQTINIGINGILDAIIEALDNMDVDTIAKDIADMLSKIDFGEIFTKVLKIAATVVSGLGKIVWESIFSGDGDLAKVLFVIIDLTVVKKLFGLLFESIGQNAITSLTTSMSKAKTEGKDLTKTLNGTTTAATSLKTGLNNAITSLGKAAESIAVLGGLRLVLDGITNLLKTFAESGLSVGESLGFLGGAIAIVTAAFTAMMLVMSKMQVSWQGIAGAAVVLAGFALVLNQVANLIDVFAKSGLSLNEVIGLMLAVFIPIVALMGSVVLLGPAMAAGLVPFSVVILAINATLAVMAATLPIILDAAGKFIKTIGPTVITIIKEIFNGVNKLIDALGKTLPPIINSVGNVFKNVFNGISQVANSIGRVIKDIFSGVSSTLSSIFNGIGNVFNNIFNGMGNVARSIGSVITSIFNGISNVVNAVGSVLERVLRSIGWLIENTLNSLLRFVYQIGPAVENSVNAILRSVRNIVNFVISAVEYLVNNVVVKGINALIDGINALTSWVGVYIPHARRVYIPRFYGYAEGGFPTEGELFIANEAGPEMIGSIGNKTAVANNDQITKAIADATYSAFVQALGENSGNSNQPLNIYIGNDKVYKGYTKQQSQMSNQYGVVI